MTVFVFGLLALAALSLGLRTTGVLLSPKVHPLIRLVAAAVIGGVMTAAMLELCNAYRVQELGWGLLLSLSPVGIFDVAKWWFRWRTAPTLRY
jgi:hypothetical protein